MAIQTCSVEKVRRRLEGGDCRFIDVREFPEYAEAHVAGSRLLALGALKSGAGADLEGEALLPAVAVGARRKPPNTWRDGA
jgi:rhodanese-related sulfurtransferase